MFSIQKVPAGFRLYIDEKLIIEHTEEKPAVFIGRGHESIDEYRGNYEIKDQLDEKIGLRYTQFSEKEIRFSIHPTKKFGEADVILQFFQVEERTEVFFIDNTKSNRFFLRFVATPEEHIFGGGEQMSYFDMRGRDFPIFTSEPGVGRDKTTMTTFLADKMKAGGDYYNSNYPEPIFVSSRKYWTHMDTTAYAVLNFKNENYHEIEMWEVPSKITFCGFHRYIEVPEQISGYTGRLPELPAWTRDGIILGVQGGTKEVLGYVKQAEEAGIKIAGIWCQDWEGINITSFGQRLKWNWMWNEERYPNLDKVIEELHKKGIKFLGYINPYVVNNESLFEEAKEQGFLALNKQGEVYEVDFGEFDCGIIDFTNPKAFTWYKEIIKKYLLDFGLDGWMADFGEYLPMDAVLYDKSTPHTMHNAWPVMWAKCNYEACEEAKKLGEILYFMRAGGHGSQKYCVSLWAGDQSVIWEKHDGMPSVIIGALSSGLIGNPYHHSDIGGYTSLVGNIRTKELYQRWVEMAVFTSVMRTHEGNRPAQNFQYYHDEYTMEHMKKMVDIHVGLKPYLEDLVKLGAKKGIPMQRALMLHYEEEKAIAVEDQFMLGSQILVAPVLEPNVEKRKVYLPEDVWIHFWTGQEYKGGEYEIVAPIGYPPVFYRKDSIYKDIFLEVAKLNQM